MTQPVTVQAVLAPPAKAAIFLTLTVRDGVEEQTLDVLADLAGITRAVGFREPEGLLSCVAGIGALLWDRLYDRPRPAGLHPFRALSGDVHAAPATPGDLLFHLRATRFDLCFELARQLIDRLDGVADVVDEVHGFRYFDERDMLGFVDGTENPAGTAAEAAVFVGDEDPEYAGGSYVIVQKYLHDLDAWEALSVEEQEQAIGRHKLSDIEFADEDKAANSHLTLNTITDPDGTERKIVRDNLPFGSLGAGEYGTYYIAYAADPAVTEQMLENMFIGDPPGTYDRLLDFSTAVTGCLFFVPTAELLDDPGEPPAAAGSEDGDTGIDPGSDTQAPRDTPLDTSLGIGSMRRS